MPTQPPSPSELAELCRRILPDRLGVWLYGSLLSGHFRPDSDIDLAVLMPRALTPLQRFDHAEELAAILQRDVDLVDMRTAPLVLRAQIAGNGLLIDVTDQWAVDSCAMYALSDYARLNEERRPVLQALGVKG